MENIEDILTTVIEIDGKEFFLVNTVEQYMFYSELGAPSNFYIFKEVVSDGEEYIVTLDDEEEYDKALVMYYDKFGEAV